MQDDITVDKLALLDRANKYRKYGGIVPFLMKTVSGMRDFVYDKLVKEKISAVDFVKALVEKFPGLPSEQMPSSQSVAEFMKKMKEENGDSAGSIALALKDELRILQVMQDFNFFEQRMALYEKSDTLVQSTQRALDKCLDILEKTNLPSSALFESIAKLTTALEARARHLEELDSLAVRFGLMPPKQEKNILFAQQNITITEEHEQVMKQLGLTASDFADENYPETLKKVINYYGAKLKKPEGIEAFRIGDQSNGGDGEGKEIVVEG